MKKILSLVLVIVAVATLFCGCSEPKTMTVDLAKEPIQEKDIELTGGKTLQIDFIFSEAGYFKLLAYDNTEYEVWPDGFNKAKLEFVDKNGKVLHKFDDISGGYADKIRFEKGTVTAKITFDKKFKDMNKASVSWGFAPDTDEAQVVEVGGWNTTAAKVNGKKAKFTFTVSRNGLYDINCGELCTFESDCTFKIEDSKGNIIADKVSIHETEWYYRKFFLTKGEYIITASGISGVARCSVVPTDDNSDEALTEIPSSFVVPKFPPILFGVVSGEKKINGTFTADGSVNRLSIGAEGPSSFYDSQQTYGLVIKNASGEVVLEEEVCEPSWFDISEYKGDYTFTLTTHGNGVYGFALLNYSEE